MTRIGGPIGPPRGVEQIGTRMFYECDVCASYVDESLDATPWMCPECGYLDRAIEMFTEECRGRSQ